MVNKKHKNFPAVLQSRLHSIQMLVKTPRQNGTEIKHFLTATICPSIQFISLLLCVKVQIFVQSLKWWLKIVLLCEVDGLKRKKDPKKRQKAQNITTSDDKKRRKINNNTPEILNSHSKIHKHLQEPGTETYCCGIVSLSFFFHPKQITQTGHACFFCFAFPNHQKLLFQLTICNDNKFFPNDWPSSPTVNISHLNQPIIGPQIEQTRQHTDLPVCSLRQGAYKLRQNSIPRKCPLQTKPPLHSS